jgi:hypothetical protein
MIRKNWLFSTSFFLALTLLMFATGVSPAFADDDDWDNLTVVLSPENPVFSVGVFSVGEYTIEALGFDGYGEVWVEVSKNGMALGEVVLEDNSTAWSYIDDRNIRLKAGNVSDMRILPMFGTLYSPKAEIICEIKKRDLETVSLYLSLDPEEDEYSLDDDVVVEMELRNTGDVKADRVRLEVDSDGLIIRESCPEKIILGKKSEKSCDLKFRFPDSNLKKTYNVTVQASWTDGTGEHSLSENAEIEIIDPLNIYKNVCSETDLEETVYVSISVENVQGRAMKVRLLDVLPSSFTHVDDSDSGGLSDLSWEFELAPEERKSFTYSMKPGRLGGYRIPEAHAYIDFDGQFYATSSDMENDIIRVYRKITYMEYDPD